MTLIQGGSQPEYVEPGYLLYAASGALRAVRFDPRNAKVIGDPVPVVEQVMSMRTGAAEYSISRTGTLLYVPGSGLEGTGTLRTLVWTTRNGAETSLGAPPRAYWTLRLAPDDTRIALEVRDQSNDIWIWDGHALTRLTSDPDVEDVPIWAHDGRRVGYGSARSGFANLFRQNADGTGAVDRLTTAPHGQWATSLAPDDGLVITEERAGGDISLMARDRRITPVLNTPFGERNGELSPDRHWMVYQSSESGESQIYVRPYPNVDAGRWMISTNGGTQPAWAPGGRELFFVNGNNDITSVAVPIQTSSTFTWGTPKPLFKTGMSAAPKMGRTFDVARDGRIVHIKDVPANAANAPPPANMVVVLNWLEEVKTKFRAP